MNSASIDTSANGAVPLPDYDGDELRRLGLPAERIDGHDLVTGKTRFISDISLPDMAYGLLVRSPHGRAQLTSIELTEAMETPGVLAVLSPADVEQYAKSFGRPLLSGSPLYAGEPVALIVAETLEAARAGRDNLSLEFEAADAVMDITTAAGLDETCYAKPVEYSRGDIDQGLAEADVVHTVTYRTAAETTAALTPPHVTAQWEHGAITIWEATADMQQSRDRVAEILQLPETNVRIIALSGGGSGGHVEPGNALSVLAGLMARQLDRPVQLQLQLDDHQAAGGYYPPTKQTLTIGARQDGTLTAIQLEGLTTCGAYETPADDILARAAQISYACPHVETGIHTVLTNRPPALQLRGALHIAGAYALEHHLDQLANRLNLSPLEIRCRNSTHYDPVSQRPHSSGNIGAMIEKAMQILENQLPDIERTNGDRLQKGRGWAVGVWPATTDAFAETRAILKKNGRVQIVAPIRETGSGASTWIAQIVAEEFDMPPGDVQVQSGDTIHELAGPQGQQGYTVNTLGPAVRQAAVILRDSLLQTASELLSVDPSVVKLSEGRVYSPESPDDGLTFTEIMEQIDARELVGTGHSETLQYDVSLRSFGLHCAEVTIDTWTGHITTDMYFALHDSGLIMNPLTARTLVEGAVAEGIARLCFRDAPTDSKTGVPLGRTLQRIGAPVAPDLPNIDFAFSTDIDTSANSVAAKALNGASSLPVAPAVANAVLDAIGIPVTELPMLPDRLLNCIADAGMKEGDRA